MLPELLAQLFGQPGIDALRDKKGSPYPGGNMDASLGVASAVMGSVGLLFGLLVALIVASKGTASGTSLAGIALIAGIGVLSSFAGYHFGRTAPRVSSRFIDMARYGVVVSVVGMVLSVAVLGVSAAGIFL